MRILARILDRLTGSNRVLSSRRYAWRAAGYAFLTAVLLTIFWNTMWTTLTWLAVMTLMAGVVSLALCNLEVILTAVQKLG